jgi:hypothetical protein
MYDTHFPNRSKHLNRAYWTAPSWESVDTEQVLVVPCYSTSVSSTPIAIVCEKYNSCLWINLWPQGTFLWTVLANLCRRMLAAKFVQGARPALAAHKDGFLDLAHCSYGKLLGLWPVPACQVAIFLCKNLLEQINKVHQEHRLKAIFGSDYGFHLSRVLCIFIVPLIFWFKIGYNI